MSGQPRRVFYAQAKSIAAVDRAFSTTCCVIGVLALVLFFLLAVAIAALQTDIVQRNINAAIFSPYLSAASPQTDVLRYGYIWGVYPFDFAVYHATISSLENTSEPLVYFPRIDVQLSPLTYLFSSKLVAPHLSSPWLVVVVVATAAASAAAPTESSKRELVRSIHLRHAVEKRMGPIQLSWPSWSTEIELDRLETGMARVVPSSAALRSYADLDPVSTRTLEPPGAGEMDMAIYGSLRFGSSTGSDSWTSSVHVYPIMAELNSAGSRASDPTTVAGATFFKFDLVGDGPSRNVSGTIAASHAARDRSYMFESRLEGTINWATAGALVALLAEPSSVSAYSVLPSTCSIQLKAWIGDTSSVLTADLELDASRALTVRDANIRSNLFANRTLSVRLAGRMGLFSDPGSWPASVQIEMEEEGEKESAAQANCTLLACHAQIDCAQLGTLGLLLELGEYSAETETIRLSELRPGSTYIPDVLVETYALTIDISLARKTPTRSYEVGHGLFARLLLADVTQQVGATLRVYERQASELLGSVIMQLDLPARSLVSLNAELAHTDALWGDRLAFAALTLSGTLDNVTVRVSQLAYTVDRLGGVIKLDSLLLNLVPNSDNQSAIWTLGGDEILSASGTLKASLSDRRIDLRASDGYIRLAWHELSLSQPAWIVFDDSTKSLQAHAQLTAAADAGVLVQLDLTALTAPQFGLTSYKLHVTDRAENLYSLYLRTASCQLDTAICRTQIYSAMKQIAIILVPDNSSIGGALQLTAQGQTESQQQQQQQQLTHSGQASLTNGWLETPVSYSLHRMHLSLDWPNNSFVLASDYTGKFSFGLVASGQFVLPSQPGDPIELDTQLEWTGLGGGFRIVQHERIELFGEAG